MKFYRSHVLVAIDDNSLKAGVKEIEAQLKIELEKNNLTEEINVLETGGLGYFGTGVSLTIFPDQVTYTNLKKEDLSEIVREHLLKGRVVSHLILNATLTNKYNFNYKNRVVLENSGIIDPENIEEYIGTGGYEAWEEVLTKMSPTDVVNEVKASGLRGRGGAGFPAGIKWSFTAPLASKQKYIVGTKENQKRTNRNCCQQ